MSLRVGESVEVTVEKSVYRGQGLGRLDGQVVFIPRGLPGERWRARVKTVTAGYAEAVPEALLQASSERRESPCPFSLRCGGCTYQELDYAAQLRVKEAVLRESLTRAGAPWTGEITVQPSPEQGWRTRAAFHFRSVEGELRLGLHEEGTRRVVDLPHCLQISSGMNTAARGIRAALQERPDLWRHVRGLDLAESTGGDERVAALLTDLEPREATSLRVLAEAAPGLTGFGVTSGRRGERYLALRGESHVRATVLGFELRAHVRSFFQANRFLIEDLARAVVEATPPGGTALDLYAGVGLFALPLSARCEEVTGMELNPTSVEDARANIRAAGRPAVRVHRGDVRAGLAARRPTGDERIILDPPRTGAGAEVVRAIASRRPQAVVYVSCDPPTLGRDLATFAREGYRADLLRAFDFFPDTFHLETLVRLVPV